MAALSSPARGDPSGGTGAEGIKERAKASIAKAREAFDAGGYADAARIYVEIYDLLTANGLEAPPEILFNAGLAFERSGACDLSVDRYERFLRARPDAALASDFTERLEQARRCAPKVTLATEPPRANVTIDGERRGTTPIELRLRSGEHKLELALDGREPVRVVITVKPGSPFEGRYPLPPVRRSSIEALAPAEPIGPSLEPWALVSGVAGGLSLAVGAILYARERSAVSRYDAEVARGPDLADAARARAAADEATDLAVGSRVALGAALIAFGAAGLLWLLDAGGGGEDAASPEQPSAFLGLGSSRAGDLVSRAGLRF